MAKQEIDRRIAVRPNKATELAIKDGDYGRMLRLIGQETLLGLEGVLGTLIESSDRLSGVMTDLRGRPPEPISPEIRQLLRGIAEGSEESLASFVGTPAALEWLGVLNQLRMVPSGEVAEVARHLVDRGLLPVKNERWYQKRLRRARGVAKRVYMQLPEGAIALAEIPQVMAAFEVCRWWAERVVEAQEIADSARVQMDLHLNEGDSVSALAVKSVEALERYMGEMKAAQAELESVLTGARGLNVMTDGKERVSDAKRARDLLDRQAKTERQQAEAAARLTAAVLELDEMIKNMDGRHSEGKVYLRALLAASRRLAVTERGLKVTLASIRLIMSAAVAQGYIAQAASLSHAVDDYEQLLVGAVGEALGSAQSHYRLLVSPQKEVDQSGDVVDGEYKVEEIK